MSRLKVAQARLAPPSYRISLLRTIGLARLEADGLAHTLVVITAPAGYGKTVTLSQWRMSIKDAGAKVAWLALGREPIDPPWFLTHLTTSLIEAGIDLGRIKHHVENGFADTPVPAAAASLFSHLRDAERPIAIVIDDAHHLSREANEQVLAPLLDARLPAVHVALAGRTRPLLALADLRARGEMLEITADSMRFTTPEIAQLLPDVPPAQRELLATRTEGWPVALQLARLWLAADPARLDLIAGFSGHTAEVAEFLTEQVLGDLPDSVRSTLESTAPLDSLSAGLVEAVTGSPGAWAGVLSSASLSHLVVPVDDRHEVYRLHPLLADHLRARLHRTDPGAERTCHAKASAWYEEQGLRVEAVRHAAASGDIARAAALVEKTGGWELVLLGGTGLLMALVREIPTHRLAEFPRVEMYRAVLDAKSGQVLQARKRFDEARAAVSRDGVSPAVSTPVGRDLYIVGHLLARYEDRIVEPDALSAIYGELVSLSPDDAIGRACLLNVACLRGLALGAMTEAQIACRRAVQDMRDLGLLLGVNYCSLHLGLATLHLGHRREAEAIFREASELAEENFGADSGLRALSDIHLAIALVGRNDIEGASKLFNRSLDHIEQADGWLDIYAEGYAAAIAAALAEGSVQAAEGLAERAERTSARRRLTRLHALANALRARLHIRAGRFVEAGASDVFKMDAVTAEPFHWRERHAIGMARAELELATGNVQSADAILADLQDEAASMQRSRDLRDIRYLSAISAYARGACDEASTSLLALLAESLPEDDTFFLVQFGPVAIPMLQFARQWTRDRGASALARHAIGEALARLARIDLSVDDKAQRLLSEREQEVLMELAHGSPNKVIARALHMTENTVKFHLKNIFQKLDVRHRAQAIRAARDKGLIR